MDTPAGKLPFTKMHGLGNDFVVVDLRRQPDDVVRAAFDGDRIRALADRRTGIGFDQWLTLHEAGNDSHARYRIMNADGTEVGQCGNGARCVAAWLVQHDGLDAERPIRLASAGGEVTAHVGADGTVSTTLPAPTFEPGDVPLRAESVQPHYALPFDGTTLRFAALSLGNPHCVIYTDEAVADVPLQRIADTVDASGLFPDGVNVGVARVTGPDTIALRVRERGVGETRACGTGAAAAAVVGIRDGLVGAPVTVRLPGGALVVDWRASGGAVAISGPAATAFEGFVTL